MLSMGEWMAGWTDGQTDGWTDGRIMGKWSSQLFHTKPLRLSERACDNPEIGSSHTPSPPPALFRKLTTGVKTHRCLLLNLRASFAEF